MSDETRLADELSRIYDVLEECDDEVQSPREAAVLRLMGMLTDYGRAVALQREHPTPNQKLFAAVGDGELPDKPADPGSWPDYAGDHEEFTALMERTDPTTMASAEVTDE